MIPFLVMRVMLVSILAPLRTEIETARWNLSWACVSRLSL